MFWKLMNYLFRCSKSEVSFVNEMLSLIKKGSFESRICISILRFAYDQPLSFSTRRGNHA